MAEAVNRYVQAAKDNIKVARHLLEAGYPGFASSRAFYAMLHAAMARLEGREVDITDHWAVIDAIGSVRPEFRDWLADAEGARASADDLLDRAISPDECRTHIDRAEQMLHSLPREAGEGK